MTPMIAAAVLIELFTSEGCSSCPPADAVLARLHRDQPISGVQLLVLSEHVDYWNNLGWKDPYSDALFSERQELYGSRIYTPQVIVDGRTDVLGSNLYGILQAARAAAREQHGAVRLERTATGVRLSVTNMSEHSDARVMVAVVEDGLVSRVEKGENAGRTLEHTAVVRALREAGKARAGEAGWAGEVPVPMDVSWKRPRVIAFVQDTRSRRILAAGGLEEQRDGGAAERHQGATDDQAHGAKQAHAP